MVPPSTDMPRVLCLKGFWAFCMRADVSQCFHRASTGADTTAGTAVSPKNAERFTENGERFSENGERFFLCTAISRTYLMCERIVKRLWNVGNAPAHPRALYLLGFQHFRERWNLFFENCFLNYYVRAFYVTHATANHTF